MPFILEPLPPIADLESRAILRKVAAAHRYLAELKGVAATIPNESILINTLALQEAKDSSAVENIITTHDDLFRAELFTGLLTSPATKEVQRYANALKKGFALVREQKLLTLRHILAIQQELEQNNAGFRRLPGTVLRNGQTGEVVYTPPQEADMVIKLMSNLELFINDDTMLDVDPLVKMAVVHYQFESIHPFYDGNGRTGRIINILYLVQKELLNLPILYLSRYIIQNKAGYYEHLQAVRDQQNWESWILYILDGVEQTARQTIVLIQAIRDMMQQYKHNLRVQLPKLYSQDLLNNLFRHPYTKIDFLMDDLRVTRLTATRYLELLTEQGFVHKQKIGRSNYYVNQPLMKLFVEVGNSLPQTPVPLIRTITNQ
ncbi:Fic family protein [Larkinella humicola]|uniref:Fic family protein n=1 Tax=Larkinella humicola TaxID=2607654 RepID=A0A5N1JCL3_9BACT|nr:Fic family protein [Larkinella humicola]KAA9353014.1 Fic family protein [Larkinella humicola]